MAADSTQQIRMTQATRTAQATCLFLGVLLLVHAGAPLFVQRVIANCPPSPEMLMVAGLRLALSVLYIVLGVYVGRGSSRALMGALGVSSFLMVLAIVGGIMTQTHAVSVVLGTAVPAAVVGASWLALEARRGVRS